LVFSLADHWVWDFWTADDGELFHLFYLHAPKSLGHPDLRHRNARIGHATSTDLVNWTNHGRAFEAGDPGTFDGTATWTGSVVRGHDGKWRMYYTGSRFLSTDSNANIETVGLLESEDLFNWTKLPGPISAADPRWYETLGSSAWPEEAWRDPWVFADPDGKTWHMLVTARAAEGELMHRGVVGHATSSDMRHWDAQPPLSAAGYDFAHLEVLQTVLIRAQHYTIFSCDTPRLAGRRAGEMGGIWWMKTDGPLGRFDVGGAKLLAPQYLYAGRLVADRRGQWHLMAFDNRVANGDFIGSIIDPIPLVVDEITGDLSLARRAAA
jgi:beta-fructofuranosidase